MKSERLTLKRLAPLAQSNSTSNVYMYICCVQLAGVKDRSGGRCVRGTGQL